MKKYCYLYKSSINKKRHFLIDIDCILELQNLIIDVKFKKKLDYIVTRILDLNTQYYEDYVKLVNYESITEIRIFPNGMNARIYCKEIKMEDGHVSIVASKFLQKKKSMKIDKDLQNKIKIIENYIYEINI